MIEDYKKRSGIECDFYFDVEDINLPQELSTNIFRIVQESLTNCLRHASATRIRVSLESGDGQLMIKIRDNGKGVTDEQITNPKSFGIMGMKARVLYLGGEFKIKGIKNRGTTVTVAVPLK